eukprot:TRINITY_DN14878_c0_g1_i2.p1 TRINITY_DN14878_c0_g1~~TRINITY_DN14878_c0_g1_i2.p1  ORF type:complete len:401 (+),score=126.88 TRINITY_DN14878_c0_g1_i2:71-1204(+)
MAGRMRRACGCLADAVSAIVIIALLGYALWAARDALSKVDVAAAWQLGKLLQGDASAAELLRAAGAAGLVHALLTLAVLVLLWRQMLLERDLRTALQQLEIREGRRPATAVPAIAAGAVARLVGARRSRPPTPAHGHRTGALAAAMAPPTRPGERTAAMLREWQARMAHSGSWAPVPSFADPDGRDAKVMEDPTSSVPTFRVQGTLMVPMEYFLGYLTATHPADLQLRKDLDAAARELRTVEVCSPTVTVGYTRIGAPTPLNYTVADRDVVYEMQQFRHDPGTIYVCCSSVERPDLPPVRGVVRGDTQTFYCIRSSGAESCTVDFAAAFNPKGMIPTSVLHLFKGKTGSFFISLRRFLEQRYLQNMPSRHGARPPRG